MTLRSNLLIPSLAMLCMLSLGGSCASNGGYYEGGDGGGYYGPPPPEYRPPPPEYRPPPPDYRPPPGGWTDHLPEYDRPNRIPRWSDLVREGHGKLKWTADLNGSVYVYDIDKDFIRYVGPVRRGQEIVVVPDDDRVYIDGRVVMHENIVRSNHHQIYFARERQGSGGGGNGGGYQGGGPDNDRNEIPKNAQRMDRGRGDLKIDAARRAGTVYIWDDDSRRLIYSTRIQRGNSFQMFPSKDAVNVNSRKAGTVRFQNGHTYSLYFLEG